MTRNEIVKEVGTIEGEDIGNVIELRVWDEVVDIAAGDDLMSEEAYEEVVAMGFREAA